MSGFKTGFSRVPKHSRFNYESRYAKEEKGIENRRKSITLEKGAFYKNSKTLSKFRDPSISHYKQNTRSRKRSLYLSSLAMMTCVFLFFNIGSKYVILGRAFTISPAAGIFALLFLLILLIFFIRLNNKT